MIPGNILLIDKPVGITSFDVIRRLRREYHEKNLPTPKMGHAGTLDPLASGLMIIGIGSGTKTMSDYSKLSKEYVTEILVGEKRTTGDMEGNLVESIQVESIKEDEIKKTLEAMVGVLELPVSAYSAIKKDGVPMYKRARKAEKEGKTVEDVPNRRMEVFEAEYLGHECANERCMVRVRFYVSSGTYIRSLGEEFGRRLGYPATLRSLRRTKIGECTVEAARSI